MTTTSSVRKLRPFSCGGNDVHTRVPLLLLTPFLVPFFCPFLPRELYAFDGALRLCA